METEITILQKLEFCKKHGIRFKEFYFHFEIFQMEEKEKRLKKKLEKAWKKQNFRNMLAKALIRAA